MVQVREFHEVGKLRIGERCAVLDDGDDAVLVGSIAKVLGRMAEDLAVFGSGSLALRARLMVEELGETLEAAAKGDVVEVADGLADLAYVTAGTAIEWGIPLVPVLDEVHASNMAKFPPCLECDGLGLVILSSEERYCAVCGGRGRLRVLDENGKVKKPEGWEPPDVARVLVGNSR